MIPRTLVATSEDDQRDGDGWSVARSQYGPSPLARSIHLLTTIGGRLA
jgi:hypothetical protein